MNLLKIITSPKDRFEILSNKGLLNWMTDSEYLKKRYYYKVGSALNLDNPQKYTEKLQWLKLHERNSKYTAMVDKYAVRDYVSQKIGNEYLIPLLGGPWKKFSEIDFSELPDQFVLTCAIVTRSTDKKWHDLCEMTGL